MWVHRQASDNSAGAPLPAVGNLGRDRPSDHATSPARATDVLPSPGNTRPHLSPAGIDGNASLALRVVEIMRLGRTTWSG